LNNLGGSCGCKSCCAVLRATTQPSKQSQPCREALSPLPHPPRALGCQRPPTRLVPAVALCPANISKARRKQGPAGWDGWHSLVGGAWRGGTGRGGSGGVAGRYSRAGSSRRTGIAPTPSTTWRPGLSRIPLCLDVIAPGGPVGCSANAGTLDFAARLGPVVRGTAPDKSAG
jgi:hypothetical protein